MVYQECTHNVFLDDKPPATFWIGWIEERHFTSEANGFDDADVGKVEALTRDLNTIARLLVGADRYVFLRAIGKSKLLKPLELLIDEFSKLDCDEALMDDRA